MQTTCARRILNLVPRCFRCLLPLDYYGFIKQCLHSNISVDEQAGSNTSKTQTRPEVDSGQHLETRTCPQLDQATTEPTPNRSGLGWVPV